MTETVVEVRVGTALGKSEPVAVVRPFIVPRIGETVSVRNAALRVVDVVHHPFADDNHGIVLIATSGSEAKDAEIIERCMQG